MAANQAAGGDAAQPLPKIHEASRATGGSGAVIKGSEIDEAHAVIRRQRGEDVVVCGDNLAANRQTAINVELAVGPVLRQPKHSYSAGPQALPHFQQKNAAARRT
ncbi:MAG TPA: hypothetical protein VMV69_24030 [Pirellulales bacterium]|nr:hypothetical protein [Pirellulales bacterium]